MKKILFAMLLIVVFIFGLNACRNIRPPTVPPSGTATVTKTFFISRTPTVTVTITPTHTVTSTRTFTRTITPTRTISQTHTISPTFTVTPTATKVEIRVNCGRAPDCFWCGVITGHTDSGGYFWNADKAYSAGSWGYINGEPGYSTDPVANSTPDSDDLLYYFNRSGSPNNQLLYRFTVPNGDYTVRLYFSETFFSAAGLRVFNMYINSVQVLTNFDIYDAVGHDWATNYSFDSTVTGGYIDVSATASTNFGLISGIAILQK